MDRRRRRGGEGREESPSQPLRRSVRNEERGRSWRRHGVVEVLVQEEEGHNHHSETETLNSDDNNNVNEVEMNREGVGPIIPDNMTDLRPFLDPVIPGPVTGPLPQDTDGWNTIDQKGAWECASSMFTPLEEVPRAFRKAWSNALSTVLQRVLQAEGETELTRALKWFLALPKLLLREPKRGGKKGQGTGEVQARFESVREGNWGTLLTLLRRDEELERRRRSNMGEGRRIRHSLRPGSEKLF